MILFPVMLQNKEGLRVCLQRGSTCHLGELGAPPVETVVNSILESSAPPEKFERTLDPE